MTRLLTVRLSENQDSEADGEYRDEVVLARVLELVEQGYTSGYEPSWEISEEADALEASARPTDAQLVKLLRDYFHAARLSQGPVTEAFRRLVKRAKKGGR